MKRLDRYVGRIVLGAFLAALVFFLFLFVLVDLLNSLSRYVDRAAEQGVGGFELAVYLAMYYANLMPVVFTTVTPFATVIACMFSVARLHNANEIVPMLFVGRSIHRVLRPMLWCGALAAALMVACWQWVVPHVGAELVTNQTFLSKGSSEEEFLVLETHGEVSRYLYVLEFRPAERRVERLSMLVVGDLAAEATLTTADVAVWDDEVGDWRLENGWLRRTHVEERCDWLGRPDVTPAVLLQQSRETIDPETLSYTDLIELAEARPNRADVRLALHRHITYPLANLLLLLLALPMAVRYERGSRIDRILAAIGLCGGYMLMDLTCQQLGQKGMLHPIVAAWTPTIVFGSLGVVLYGSTRT